MRAAAPIAGARTASPGFSDAEQLVCLSLALWNGRDPILKERLFGLTNAEGNHGEDVKEHYFYLDATPTHSYLKMLYKYPQRAFPLCGFGRGERAPRHGGSGVRAAGHRYFRRRSLLRRVRRIRAGRARRHPDEDHRAWNRGAAPAALHLIPQLVLRNTWSLGAGHRRSPSCMPLRTAPSRIEPAALGMSRLYFDGNAELLFTENESNAPRLWNTGGAGLLQGWLS